MLDISGLVASLADTRKVFHSEADFQHALAWHIHHAMPERVLCNRTPSHNPTPGYGPMSAASATTGQR